ncbi:lysosomal-trafficking regulator [Latimeria chalumnae]|uniref:lysosomal-trafficking regulator n=1 Tax=Latimeria chalumnae TaxID=7897 RepID=UPI00313D370C
MSRSNALAREFLTDVHQLCNAVAQKAEAKEEEEEERDMVALGEYLVHGRGFFLLTTLDSILDQELTCREELLTLLLSLLPLVWKIPVQEDKVKDFDLSLLEDILLIKESKESRLSLYKTTQEKPASEGSSLLFAQTSLRRTLSNWKARRPRRTAQRYSVKDAKKPQLSTSDSEAISDDKNTIMMKQRRLKILQPHASHHLQENYMITKGSCSSSEVVGASNEDTMSLENRFAIHKLDAEILTDPAAVSIVNKMEHTPFDLCYVLLSILEKVSKFDMLLNHNPVLTTSVVPTLTEFLSGFGECCEKSAPAEREIAVGWTEEPVALVQRMLLRTVLHLLSVDINNGETMPDTLRRNLKHLLRATLKIKGCLEKQADPFAPRRKTTLQEVHEYFSYSKYRHRSLLLPELLGGVLQILICCLQTASSNPFYFSQAIDLIHEFIQHHGFELFETTVLQMEWLITRDEASSSATEHVKTLINSVMKIISTIKKLKSEQLHQSVCTRKRHRRCEYSHLLHHHRDLSGLPMSGFRSSFSRSPFDENTDGEIQYPEGCCCIAVCVHQCLRLLQQVSLNNTCVQILSGIYSVGVCCCMDPRLVIVPILHAFKLQMLKSFQQQILSILNKLILEQLGGGEASEKAKQAACNICTVNSSQLLNIEEIIERNGADVGPGHNVSGPSCGYQGVLPSEGSEDMLWKWDSLEAYQNLAFSDNKQHSQQVAAHICHLALRGNAVVQWQLYSHVFNPILQRGVELAHHAQQLGVTTSCTNVCGYHSGCLPQEILQVYLQTLPSLFNSRVIRDMFLSCNGLNQVTEMLYLDSVRSYILKIFETLIVRLGEQQNKPTGHALESKAGEQKGVGFCPVESGSNQQTSLNKTKITRRLIKFYAGLKEAYPKRKKINLGVHVNVINLFLCVVFLSVSKEGDSEQDLADDSEDTSGCGSTASEPVSNLLPCLSPENISLPSKEEIRRAADIWSMCRWIYLSSVVFQKQFYQLGSLEMCYRLMMMIIQELSKIKDNSKSKDGFVGASQKNITDKIITSNSKYTEESSSFDSVCAVSGHHIDSRTNSIVVNEQCVSDDTIRDVEQSSRTAPILQEVACKPLEEEWPLHGIRLLEAVLAICLHSASNSQQESEMEFYYQSLSVEEILSEMREQLAESGVVESSLIKPLFDSLLRVALGGYSADYDSSQEKVKKIHIVERESLSQQGDLSEEADESQCCNIQFFAEEEGYEADSESNPEDTATKEEEAGEKTETASVVQTFCLSGHMESIIPGELMYPEICLLELSLLSVSSPSLDVLIHVFRRLLNIIRHSEKNAILMIQQGVVKMLLGGFQNILSQSLLHLEECQEVLVDMLAALMSSRTTSEEFAALLRIFLEKTPPARIILKGILNIVEANTDVTPLQYLPFPAAHFSTTSAQNPSTAVGSKNSSLLRRAKFPQTERETGTEALAHHLLSSWHIAPIHLPMVGQNCWPHMSEGFSISLWLNVNHSKESEYSSEKGRKKKKNRLVVFSDSSIDGIEGDKSLTLDHPTVSSTDEKLIENGCLHLISLGSKALMFQVWADLSTGSLTFRICVDPNDGRKSGLLAEAETQENIIDVGKWQHFAITFQQQTESKKNIHGKLTLWVCGQRKSEVALDYAVPKKTSLSSDNKTFCMIGHCASTQEEALHLAGRWGMGTLLLFNGARIAHEEAFYLYVCGPDFTSVMPCKYEKTKANYSKYINQEILYNEQIKEFLVKNKDVDIGPLTESLAIVYTPSCPTQYTIYEPIIRLKGQAKGAPSQRPFSVKEVQGNTLDPQQLKHIQPVEHKGLQNIVHEIGGTGAFIFLFARVVEIDDCEMTQALALRIVLSLTKYNQHRVQEMERCHGFSMIHQVLIKPRCIVGFHILKTLLDACCCDQILSVSEDGQFKLDVHSNAVIQDVKLLTELLLDWKIWSKAQKGVWETLVAALEILIQANHPHQKLNIKQLLKANIVHRFLLTCQVLQENRDDHLTSMPQEACRSFVKIIEELLGSPPDLELLKLIFNFLLAVHPATNTYVCHTPSSFYFSLHMDGKIFQEKVQSIMHLRKSSGTAEFSFSPASGFAATHSKGNGILSFSDHHSSSSSTQLQRSKSLPVSPVSLPFAHVQMLKGRLDRSCDDVMMAVKNEPLSTGFLNDDTSTQENMETIKGAQDELFISSCESVKTVCEIKERPATQSNVELPKQKSLLPFLDPENAAGKTQVEDSANVGDVNNVCNISSIESEPKNENAADGVRRPDSLKGLYSFQRSQSSFASLGLAFPVQNGSLAVARWPSITDRSLLPEDWESLAFSPAYEHAFSKSESLNRSSTEDCLVLVCCGLYDLLYGVLRILPDMMIGDVMDKLIHPEALIVLVNHPSPLIQQGVLKLLDAYFYRASREQREKFLKNYGFSLLANQLYLHQGTQQLLEYFLAMFFGRPIGLDEDLDLDDIGSIDPFRKRCIIPVLGLIENSLHENSLVHNTLCVLLQILNACPKMADLLLDNGLLYVLFNTLAALNEIEANIPLNDYKLLVCDIQQLLEAVTIHSCSSSGSQYFRIIEDLITLLGYLQSCKSKRTQDMAVALQFKVLQSAIELIKTTANQDAQNLASSFHLPSVHHHAMYQKRKSIAGPRLFSVAQSETLLMKMRSVASDELTTMMQKRMSQENPIRATETEFVQRLQRLTVLAVNRLIYQDPSRDCLDLLNMPESTLSPFEACEEEGTLYQPSSIKTFQKEMLKILLEGIKLSLGTGRSSAPRHHWKRILWSCKDTFRVQLGRLLVYTLSPACSLEERKQALQIVSETNLQDILRECLNPALEHGQKLALYLYELAHDHKEALANKDKDAAELFMTSLKFCGYKCIPPSAPPKPDLIHAIKEEQKKCEIEENKNKTAWEKKKTANQQSLIQRLDAKSKDISKISADITQNISLHQGMERKKVIQHIRGLYKFDLSASRYWQELVQHLTHDRAIWYDPASYPTSWQLDATEGPNRERRRLQRCYLTIPNKYLLKDRQKPGESIRPPLSYLFEDQTHFSFSSTVKDKATSEPIRFTRRCVNVAPSRETSGELLLGKSGMYFVEDNATDTYENPSPLGETEPASFSWTYEEIKEFHKRWWQLRDNAVEIFLTNGRTLLLAFDNTKVRDDVYHNILMSNLPNLLEYGNITALTHLWCSGQITNFEYLTHLNKHAGRSFNDLMQYPVFPFILRDYSSETVDLSDPSIYRNLSKPIAVQSKEKEDRYVDNYRYLEEEYFKGAREDDPMPPVQPYHYGSHYSNSGTVLHFLVRMPPFTRMFLAYQDQSFDIPDRTFHSMNTTWRLSSFESMTDVKELIPEFFYLPEFLVNREGFDFGVRQNGERVNHVNLPPWARNDSRLFILIHRQALESDHVSQTLCQWIDLVFGYKQKGKAAVQAINVFHPATYFGMDVSAVEDPVQRRALETMIKTYGQTPRQLFNTAHLSRAGSRLGVEGELPAAMGLLVQLAFKESREHPKEILYPSPLPWVKGLKWGEYVGSPSAPDPVVCFSQCHGEKFGSLQALPTRAICGLSCKFCLMMIYSKEQGVRSMHSTDIQWSAILSWGYVDNMLRLKSKQSEPPVNFIQCSPLHQVTSCAWVSDSFQLFIGSKCGVITAFANRFTNSTPSEIEVESQVHLYGHTDEITSLCVCKPYSVLISVSKDGTCIIWDLNRLCYVQSLTGHKNPVTAVSASETTGDIATVCDSVGGGSDLRLWTVNGDLIGHVHCREIICSVAFSNQPEGVSVNVIAGGLENGIVRLWSTWDLKPVREITFPKSSKPIISLTYSSDGHHLYTANSEGTVIAWCRRDQQRTKLPLFYSFLSSYAAG